MFAGKFVFIVFLILVTGREAIGDLLDSDKEALLGLRSFLEQGNKVNQGAYKQWDSQASSPCTWPGISCSGNRVIGINLSYNNIAGKIFGNFSALTELAYLDLSTNTIGGSLPVDLGSCQNLKVLNLSHNMIDGELNLSGLSSLEILDLSVNRFSGNISMSFPIICSSLVVANLSENKFSGEIGSSIDGCPKLEYVDLSANSLTGNLWFGFHRFKKFAVCENRLNNKLQTWIFPENCSLQELDLSENSLAGEIPKEISNCKNLTILNLWGNYFSGKIPGELGLIPNLQQLSLGNNTLDSQIPESLLGLKKLEFLDLSRNSFGGDIQEILGHLTQVKTLLLHSNRYSGGLSTSGILRLQNVSSLDLSYNNLSGLLPVEISQMASLKYLFLANNQFSGSIPSEYGSLLGLQALDLSNNHLDGPIPPSFGHLSSLLWLMVANNSLTGQLPPELGNCSSLLWLNLQNNQLTGPIWPELTNMGKNATPTFLINRQDSLIEDSGECSTLRRWIPADYQPFSFVYTLLNMKKCKSLWDKILKGYGIFPVCLPESNIRVQPISGYLQLSGNRLSGQIPPGIGKMGDYSMLHVGGNEFSGTLPDEIGGMTLVVLNVSQNKFSGRVPRQLGNLKCLRNLDLSYNNFSGKFPTNLNNLTDLSSFNVSYNPYISGSIPETGQLATFEIWSYLGDPLLRLPSFIDNSSNTSSATSDGISTPQKWGAVLVFIFLLLAFLVCGVMTIIVCLATKSTSDQPQFLLWETKSGNGTAGSSPWLSDTVKVISLDKTAFTHADILNATGNFSNDRIIGRGGFGTVYRGVLPDGRVVAVKKKLREGIEGEKEFKAEMEVLTGNGFGWPHPNLVTLYGWCLDGSEKLLVYEYMEGGTLEDLIHDRIGFPWRRRINVAIDVAHALVFLHHECNPAIVHRDVKASNVLLDKKGKAHVTDFGLARIMDAGDSHVSTMVAGTVGYVAPEYGQTWQATTKGDVYSYGVLVMELATGRRAVEGGGECLVEWSRRVRGRRFVIPMSFLVSGMSEGMVEMRDLLWLGVRCTTDEPQSRPNMKEVLDTLVRISARSKGF
ncbi:probable LRR receptor-like serine/threonine-protein kinase At1g74360 [Cynara cardunculus var. scolymus]|uniref:probable LRR receptor-like serine/threonine-protein kinase At1g74360 n=1 Tax=Cynara cardunculus var. scolymus TaxID=59895 RepID=UPI000D62EBDF|nr:probable LRR receptor-like serine/threonine-protein kinase At1g74360 [Cynara cardunculus var. scolymus]